ncbi:MAG: Cro/Cl family transcriptional regulator, partial [Acidovorax sp.]
MKKTFMGVRLRRLREERGLTQVALARALEISASYLNQIEQNQRPLTVPVLLKINAVFGVDVQHFSEGDEARLIAGLRDVLADLPPGAPADAVSLAEVRELAANMPAVARVLLALHRGRAEARERLEALAAHYGDGRGGAASAAQAPPMAYEEVRDFFFSRHNHIAELDDAAEHLAAQWRLAPGAAGAALQARLEQAHGVRVALLQGGDGDEAGEGAAVQRRFDAAARVLYLSPTLQGAQRAFQMAT